MGDAKLGDKRTVVVQVENGFLVQGPELERVYQIEDNLKGLQEMLYDLVDYWGYSGSRYSEHRLYIDIRPGDKYVDGREELEEHKVVPIKEED